MTEWRKDSKPFRQDKQDKDGIDGISHAAVSILRIPLILSISLPVSI